MSLRIAKIMSFPDFSRRFFASLAEKIYTFSIAILSRFTLSPIPCCSAWHLGWWDSRSPASLFVKNGCPSTGHSFFYVGNTEWWLQPSSDPVVRHGKGMSLFWAVLKKVWAVLIVMCFPLTWIIVPVRKHCQYKTLLYIGLLARYRLSKFKTPLWS